MAVPVMLGGARGARLWASRGTTSPPFDEHDLRLLNAIAGRSPPASAAPSCSGRMAELALPGRR
jgi:hypothetical protein